MFFGYGAGEGSVTTAEGLPASAVFYATGEDFNDRGPTLYPITKVGSSFTAGYELPFGGSSSFDGVNDHINNTNSNSDIAFDTGDFTLECWVYFESSDGTLDTIVDTRSSSAASDGFLIGRFHTAGHENKIELYTDGNYRTTADVTVSDDTWTHVAVVRSSSVTTVYVDGTAYSSTYSDSNDYSNEDYILGENVDANYQFHGQICDFRMVKGTAVYTSNFAPPLALLTEIPNAKVLLCRSNISPLANVVTPGGITASGAVASWNNPFSSNFGALADDSFNFEGSDTEQYFHAGTNTFLDDSLSSWQFQCWAFYENDSGQAGNTSSDMGILVDQYESGASGRLLFGFQEDLLVMRVNGGTVELTSGTLNKQVWYHVMLNWDGTTHRLFVNGSLVDSTTTSPSIYTGKRTEFGGGGDLSDYNLHGYMKHVLVEQGGTVETSNFTPTWTFGAVAPAIDYGGSVEFDGNGGAVKIPTHSDLNLGTGDFTIEYFYKMEDSGENYYTMFTVGQGDVFDSMEMYWNSTDDTIRITKDHTERGQTGAIGSDRYDTWHHIMVTRSSGTTYTFFNGNLEDTYTTSWDAEEDDDWIIGDRIPNATHANYEFKGLISNFRVIKGTALHTSSFTVPTEPLENVTNTVLLCCQSETSVTDAAVSPTTLVAVSGATASSDHPFGGSGGGGGSDVFEMMFTEPGTYNFVPPSGVTSVNVVAVGGGGGCAHYPNSVTGTTGGGGGSLSYKNNISVTPGTTYTVTVGARGTGASTVTGFSYPEGYQTSVSSSAGAGGTSQFALGGTTYCMAMGGAGASGSTAGVGGNSTSNIGDGGGSGGDGGDNDGTTSYWAFGGGAGGYSGDGGHGGRWEAGGVYTNGATAGAGGGAGGGAGWANVNGVGVFGEGTSGGIGDPGSGGTDNIFGRNGGTQYGKYGGGGSGHGAGDPASSNIGQSGAVRIVWYSGSSFPSTSVDAPAGLTDEQLRTKGTAIGNMTQDGGLSAAFDGTTTGDYTVSARLDPSNNATIGKDFGENVSIKQVILYRPDGDGTTNSNCFPGSGNNNVTPMYLEHSHDGTTWQEAMSSDNTSNKDVTMGIGVSIVARYWRVRFTGDNNGGSVRECVFKSS